MNPTARRAIRHIRLLPDTVRSLRPASFEYPRSQLASAAQMRTDEYRKWATEMGEPTTVYNRKVWEWAYTMQALQQAQLLSDGHRALGFGCGREPLPAMLARRDVAVVATDQAADGAGGWAATNQHAESVAALRRPDICDDERFSRLVSFTPADMREIPATLRGFDIVWSSCAFEHLGSIQAGLDFVLASIDCLRPGGVAVHTTEFDLDGSEPAVDLGAVVLYRRKDLEALALELRHRGHRVACNFHTGTLPQDLHVDEPPYGDVHVRVRVGPAASTSFGLIVRRAP
ncbi:MAG: hypothetical protein ABWZ42_11730 [Ilumatobacteraceae bacterium]